MTASTKTMAEASIAPLPISTELCPAQSPNLLNIVIIEDRLPILIKNPASASEFSDLGIQIFEYPGNLPPSKTFRLQPTGGQTNKSFKILIDR